MKTFSEKLKSKFLKIYQFDNHQKGSSIELFCMFWLSTIQFNGHNQSFIQLRNFLKHVTFKSDLRRRVEFCSFREGEMLYEEISKQMAL